jgi:hypothetical protein
MPPMLVVKRKMNAITISWAPNYVFPSLANDTHIMGLLNEITFVDALPSSLIDSNVGLG